MERDLNGFPVRDAFSIASRRDALEMAALAQQAIDAGRFEDRGGSQIDPATHKPRSKWARKDGMTGQRETWQRQLSGHKAGQKRKAREAKESA
jgi:hypothetical protein